MDKAKITDIVYQASLDIKTLFPVWYENRDVDETIITSKIDEWESLIEKWKNELRIGIITNVTLIEELTEKLVEKAYKQYKISKESEPYLNIISDMPHSFIEFKVLCDIKLCQCFLDFLNSPDPTPKPAKHEFSPEMFAVVKYALEQKELITSSDIYTGKPTQLKALYNVLEKRGYILGIKNPEESFATWFQTYFGFQITDRTLRNPPNKGQEEEERDFKALIPDNK